MRRFVAVITPLGWLFAGLAGVQLAVQLVFVTQGTDYAVANLANDDTFYYLNTALNLHDYGFTTFDGIHPTNGVQFAWYWLLAGVAAFTSDKTAFLQAALMICALLNAASYLFIARLARLIGQPFMGVMLGVAWFCYCMVAPGFTLQGMENSLHGLVFWALLAQMLWVLVRNRDVSARDLLLLAALLVLNTWSRVDAGLYSALFAVGIGMALWPHVSKRLLLVGPGMVIAAGAAIMLGGFYLMGGYPLPVSGLIKQENFNWDPEFLRQVIRLVAEFVVPFKHDALRMVIVLAVVGVVLDRYLGRKQPRRRSNWVRSLGPFKTLYLLLALGAFAHVNYLAGLGKHVTYSSWYMAPLAIMAVITLALGAYALVQISQARHQRAATVLIAAVYVVGLLGNILFSERNLYNGGADRGIDPPNHYTNRLSTARWIDANLEPDALLAAWNAGQLGYFSNRRVINLDGLVNSYDYYHNVKRGDEALLDYLETQQVAYITDYTTAIPDEVRDRFTFVIKFPMMDVRYYEVWRSPRMTNIGGY